MQQICSFQNLSIGYDTGKPIAKNLDSSLYSGEILRIKGDNGSGKTTFIRTLLQELEPLSGSIKRNYTSPYYLKQSFSSQIHLPITISEILGHKCQKLNFDNCLKWNDLSGGQKQQVLIHRAFMRSIDLLVLDEPFNHLDRESIITVKNLIQDEFQRKEELGEKFGVILVSHLDTSFTRKVKDIHLC